MIGAIVGDIVGSRYEHRNIRTKDFDFINDKCFTTDDTVMSLAICDALLKTEPDYNNLSQQAIKSMQHIGRPYPRGYGRNFRNWVYSNHPRPYYSYGNGSAMRVGGCGYVSDSFFETISLSKAVTEVTHNHPEGIKGAEAVAVAIFLARTGCSMQDIRDCISNYYYQIDFTLDDIRETYQFDVSCQGSVPQALQAFFESVDFEDAIRNAISIGGDSDTIAAIAGSVAEAYYGVPQAIRKQALTFLDKRLSTILKKFEQKYPPKII